MMKAVRFGYVFLDRIVGLMVKAAMFKVDR